MTEYKKGQRKVAAGLLIIAIAQLLRQFVDVPDLLQGAVMGIGLAIEIRGLIQLKKRRSQKPKQAVNNLIGH